MSRSQRATAIVDALEAAWGRGEIDALDRILSPDYTRHGRRSEQDRNQLKSSIIDMRRAFPDLTMTVTDCVEDAETMAIRWSSTGTLTDTYLGLPPTGRTFSVTGATFSTLSGDKIASETVVYDRRGQYQSLGMEVGVAVEPRDEAVSLHDGIEPESLRSMHRKLVTGVTVVATQTEDGPRGLAVNAFSSVSLDPPRILICVQKTSSTYAHLLATKYFGVNILSADQLDVAQVFATKDPRKFDRVAWTSGPHGVPLITGACARMEVALEDSLHASTHTIFIGRVVHAGHNDRAPLVYAGGQFYDGGQLAPAEMPSEG